MPFDSLKYKINTKLLTYRVRDDISLEWDQMIWLLFIGVLWFQVNNTIYITFCQHAMTIQRSVMQQNLGSAGIILTMSHIRGWISKSMQTNTLLLSSEKSFQSAYSANTITFCLLMLLIRLFLALCLYKQNKLNSEIFLSSLLQVNIGKCCISNKWVFIWFQLHLAKVGQSNI